VYVFSCVPPCQADADGSGGGNFSKWLLTSNLLRGSEVRQIHSRILLMQNSSPMFHKIQTEGLCKDYEK
jgi:hypothetical protein